jgi:hypothetical protein
VVYYRVLHNKENTVASKTKSKTKKSRVLLVDESDVESLLSGDVDCVTVYGSGSTLKEAIEDAEEMTILCDGDTVLAIVVTVETVTKLEASNGLKLTPA